MKRFLQALAHADRVAAQARKALTVPVESNGRVKLDLKPVAVQFSSSEVTSDVAREGSSEDVTQGMKAAAAQRKANPMSRFVDVGGHDGTIVPSASAHEDAESEDPEG